MSRHNHIGPPSSSSSSTADKSMFELPDFTTKFAINLNEYVQSCVKRAIRQETAALRAEIEDLKAHVNALEVEMKCTRSQNGIPPKGELFNGNVIKYIKLEEDDGLIRENSKGFDDEEQMVEDEIPDEELVEDEEDYEPKTTRTATTSKRRKRTATLIENISQYSKYKRWRARVDDVIFDDKQIKQFYYEHEGHRFDLTKMVRDKTPNSFTNTAITAAAKDITKYFLSMIIGDAQLHLYTSSSRTRRSYEPIPVQLQDSIKDLVFSGAVSYSPCDAEELKKCISNAVETAIYDKCSYARKHPEKRMSSVS